MRKNASQTRAGRRHLLPPDQESQLSSVPPPACAPLPFPAPKNPARLGTLKLLYEGVLSALRREPVCRTLAFGLAPFCNMRDAAGLRHVHWLRWVGRFMWHRANGVYAFQNLAFSKIR